VSCKVQPAAYELSNLVERQLKARLVEHVRVTSCEVVIDS